MSTLHIPLKREYFEAIKNGTKLVEYRLYNSYWKKRIKGKAFKRVRLTLGYPKREDTSRQLIRPWSGYWVETITHPQFGDKPVTVFAIGVGQ